MLGCERGLIVYGLVNDGNTASTAESDLEILACNHEPEAQLGDYKESEMEHEKVWPETAFCIAVEID